MTDLAHFTVRTNTCYNKHLTDDLILKLNRDTLQNKMSTDYRRRLTMEKAEEIAETLRNPYETITSASVRAKLPPTIVTSALNRYENDQSGDGEYEIVQIIAEALQNQYCEHRRVADLAAYDPKTTMVTKHKQWRLECAAPKEHAKITKQELSGPDGGPIEMQELSLERLLALAASAEE